MATQKDVLGLIYPGSQVRRPPMIGMEFLHQRAMRADDRFARRTFLKSKNFISLIFGHRSSALAKAPVSAAKVSVSLLCHTPAGKPAVKISFK